MEANKLQYAKLRNYNILKSIGSGHDPKFCKVKLGFDERKNEYVAIKVIKHDHPTFNRDIFNEQMNKLLELKHPNLVRIVEFHDSMEYTKKNGKSYQVSAIIMEYVSNGEIYNFIVSEEFTEEAVRSYFQVLLKTVEYCHQQRFSHTNLKLENLLLDKDFNLKIADFGFTAFFCGKNPSSIELQTYLGTNVYMSPEVHQGKTYISHINDIFSCAIILFIMMTKSPPFLKADAKGDSRYNWLCNQQSKFWDYHQRLRPRRASKNSVFSQEFKDLMNSMMAADPSLRLTISEIEAHSWMSGETMMIDEIRSKFWGYKERREEVIRTEKAKRTSARTDVNDMIQENVFSFDKNDRRFNIFEKIECDSPEKLLRTHIPKGILLELNCHYSFIKPELLYKYLIRMSTSLFKLESSKSRYFEICGSVNGDKGNCLIKLEILKVDDLMCCVETSRIRGNTIAFYEILLEIKSALDKFESENN